MPLSFNEFRFQGLTVGGEIREEMEARRLPFENTESDYRDLSEIIVRGAATGFYWQPWLATWDTGAELDLSVTDSLIGDGESETITGYLVSGALGLFPQSRYPTRLSVLRRERYENGFLQLGDKEGDFTEFRASSSYTRTPRDSYNGSYTLTQDGFVDEQATIHELELGGNFRPDPKNSINARVNLFDSQQERTGIGTTSLVGTASHDIVPDETWRLNHFVNLTHTQTQLESGGEDSISLAQWTGSLGYSPRERPLNATVYTQLFAIDQQRSEGGDDSRRWGGSLNGNLDYVINPTLQLTANANNTFDTVDGGEENYFLNQRVQITYDPRTGLELPGTVHRWQALAGLANTTATSTTDEQEIFAGVRQDLSRNQQLGFVTALLSHNSTLDGSLATNNQSELRVSMTNAVTLTRSVLRGQSSFHGTLRAEDFRAYGLVEPAVNPLGDNSRQTVTLDLVWQHAIDGTSSITADYRAEIERTQGRHGDDDSDDDARLTVAYNNSAFMGVPRLRLGSRLILRADEDIYVDGGSGGNQRADFENDLKYLIGRMEINFEADVTREEGETGYRIFLEVVRYFGR